MNKLVKLADATIYSNKRVNAMSINIDCFITTDNMLQNKSGITVASSLPYKQVSMPAFSPNNILVANIRPYLKKIWFSNKSGGCSPDVLVFEVNERYDPKYIYYSIFGDEFFEHMMRGSKGTKMPRGDKRQILEFLIHDYEFSTQQKIANVLSILDAKIELNNRINVELETMAKTLYDYWFVQFNFPDEQGKPYKSSGGKMVWNKELKRDIPAGWVDKKLEDIENNIVTGKTPPTNNNDFFDGGVPFITIGDIRGNMHITNTQIKLSEKGAEFQKNKYIPKGAICVSCIASPGLIGFTSELSQTNQQINSIVCKKDVDRYYLYFALADYFKFAGGVKIGNTFANMNKGDFSSINLIYPTNPLILEQFSKIIKPIVSKTLNNSLEINTLSKLRDWLLPMLMNGQIKVK